MNELEAAIDRIVKEIDYRVWKEGDATQHDDWELITSLARFGEKYTARLEAAKKLYGDTVKYAENCKDSLSNVTNIDMAWSHAQGMEDIIDLFEDE